MGKDSFDSSDHAGALHSYSKRGIGGTIMMMSLHLRAVTLSLVESRLYYDRRKQSISMA